MAYCGQKKLILEFVIMSIVVFILSPSKGFEADLLLSMKALTNDQSNSLSNWNSSLPLCKWNGITCLNWSHVSRIELPGKGLSGRISQSIFRLPYVEYIDLSSNQLSGEIPGNLSSCVSLRYLNLSDNNLTGLIPSVHLPALETLDLSNNMLSGEIPGDIGLLSGLKSLDFGGNILSGNVPYSIGNITMLEFLTLASNQLTGAIPRNLALLKRLRWIYLGHNNFSGEIPKEIGELSSLYHLDLVCNNLTGKIPSSLGNLTNLQYLFLYSNKLTGPIPEPIFNLQKLVSLDLSENSLCGEIPEMLAWMQNLEVLHLFSNKLSGKIPNSLSSLPRLQVLQLWSNRLSGKIPKDLGKYNNLTVLDLSTNNLTGKVPENLCASGHLIKLILFSNSLEGKIPRSLSLCKSLARVRIQNNNLSGDLSPEFTTLPVVYYLDISSNYISGRIDDRKWDMPQLQMLNLAKNKFYGTLPGSFGSQRLESLDLSGNDFSGSIPARFGEFLQLMELKLRENELSGKIPDQLSNCKKLVSLDLSHNHLVGEIPASLGSMPVLGQLDLSANDMSGAIPSNLGEVESLVQVNVSYNHFHGHLPATGAFVAANSSAVIGNKLCGSEMTSGLPPCNCVRRSTRWFVLGFLLSSLIVLGVVVFLVTFIRRRKLVAELKSVEREDGNWELQFLNPRGSRSLTIKDVISSIREENLVASGRTGLSYKGKSSLNSKPFFAKEIASVSMSCWKEWSCRIGNVNHPNVVKLIALCRSEKSGILVYEYIEGKDLSEVIRCLSWECRLKVAVGIARALRYLHFRCFPSIIVGDVSPRQIRVDGKDEVHLRVMLPAGISPCSDSKCQNCFAYIPPESEGLTEENDIYGFGLLLIELLTGKSRGNAEIGTNGSSVTEWARYCYSDCHLETWVDKFMKNNSQELSSYQNQIVETMNLALQCTAGDPTSRPQASDLVDALESVARLRLPCFIRV